MEHIDHRKTADYEINEQTVVMEGHVVDGQMMPMERHVVDGQMMVMDGHVVNGQMMVMDGHVINGQMMVDHTNDGQGMIVHETVTIEKREAEYDYEGYDY